MFGANERHDSFLRRLPHSDDDRLKLLGHCSVSFSSLQSNRKDEGENDFPVWVYVTIRCRLRPEGAEAA